MGIINCTPINTLLNIIILTWVRQEGVLDKLHVLVTSMKLKVSPNISDNYWVLQHPREMPICLKIFPLVQLYIL